MAQPLGCAQAPRAHARTPLGPTAPRARGRVEYSKHCFSNWGFLFLYLSEETPKPTHHPPNTPTTHHHHHPPPITPIRLPMPSAQPHNAPRAPSHPTTTARPRHHHHYSPPSPDRPTHPTILSPTPQPPLAHAHRTRNLTRHALLCMHAVLIPPSKRSLRSQGPMGAMELMEPHLRPMVDPPDPEGLWRQENKATPI